MSPRDPRGPRGDDNALILREPKTARKLERPRMFKVLFHNDDYTTREFVVELLQTIFHHNEVDATAIMLHIHHHGIGVAGVFTREIAEAKVSEVMKAAEQAEFPLLCTMEPDDTHHDE